MIRKFVFPLIALAIYGTVLGETPRLLLVPSQTAIKPRGTVECDLYLYNDSNKSVAAPSFETISKVYVLRDVTGTRLPRGDSSSLIAGHPSAEHSLKPHTVESTKIKVEISAELGDLVELYVEVGSQHVLRSNSVLLFCQIEDKTPESASSPKATITPAKQN